MARRICSLNCGCQVRSTVVDSDWIRSKASNIQNERESLLNVEFLLRALQSVIRFDAIFPLASVVCHCRAQASRVDEETPLGHCLLFSMLTNASGLSFAFRHTNDVDHVIDWWTERVLKRMNYSLQTTGTPLFSITFAVFTLSMSERLLFLLSTSGQSL